MFSLFRLSAIKMKLQHLTFRRYSIFLIGCVAGSLGIGGCQTPSSTQNVKNEAPVNDTSVKSMATKTPLKGAPTNGTTPTGAAPKNAPPIKVGSPGKVTAKPSPTATMTVPQAKGIEILKAINSNVGMAGHKISVGTGPGTVWLDGSVPKAAQKTLAEKIARQKAPGAKVVNRLTLQSADKASIRAPMVGAAQKPKSP